MGALTRHVESLADLGEALDWAKTTDRTTVISIVSDAFTWSPGDAWWDVGVPAVSARESVRAAYEAQRQGREKQRVGV
jgi:3D-(3,5/4)-trihydroxycyclohexane-1,2-dione acylhydrolase (decyclizing)